MEQATLASPKPKLWNGRVNADWHRASTHRTVLDFQFDGDALAVADEWARTPQTQIRNWNQSWYPPAADFVATDADGTRLYACNVYGPNYRSGRWAAPGSRDLGIWQATFVSIRQMAVDVHFEAWLAIHGWYRIFAPAEQGISSGGFRQYGVRRGARRRIHPLLEALGRPPIP